jgi:O-acetyl-ADP-ribose deacetylase (regulator of RNase III)
MKILTGNLITLAEQGHFNVIVQGCNCFCAMGSGIAKEIRAKYPAAWEVDQATVPGDYDKLGNYTVMLGKQFNIVNAYMQYDTNTKDDFRDRVEYAAFALILQKLAHKYPSCRIGFPKIGCGLAGGIEARIMTMLRQFASELEVTGGAVTVVEFA